MTPLANQLESLLGPTIHGLGYELWGLEYHTYSGRSVLRVFIDSENGIDVDDCAKVSRQISALLDVEDPISNEYNLEVSSPGLDRPLFKIEQYSHYLGCDLKIKLQIPKEGRKNFSGTLIKVAGDELLVKLGESEAETEILIPFNNISKANLAPDFS